MLLYLYNNLTLSTQKIFPNIWNYIKSHNYKHIDQIIEKINKSVKDLKDAILNQYMIETIKPITSSIELNIYMGKYDFNDCPKPIGESLKEFYF
jgi:vacuolar-type H+-ATPase subunit C/Vma6